MSTTDMLSESRTVAKVSGISGFFDVPEGGDVELTDVTKEWDAGADEPDILPGRQVTTDLVLRRPYKPLRDRALLAASKARVGRVQRTIQIVELGAEYDVKRVRETHRGLLIAARGPKGNARNSTAGTLELVFAIKGQGKK